MRSSVLDNRWLSLELGQSSPVPMCRRRRQRLPPPQRHPEVKRGCCLAENGRCDLGRSRSDLSGVSPLDSRSIFRAAFRSRRRRFIASMSNPKRRWDIILIGCVLAALRVFAHSMVFAMVVLASGDALLLPVMDAAHQEAFESAVRNITRCWWKSSRISR